MGDLNQRGTLDLVYQAPAGRPGMAIARAPSSRPRLAGGFAVVAAISTVLGMPSLAVLSVVATALQSGQGGMPDADPVRTPGADAHGPAWGERP
jgi:hypothetical protein